MWDKKYTNDLYIYGKQPNGFLKHNIDVFAKGRVLCLAEGEGRNAVFLAKQGLRVTAVDSSIVGLNKARKLAQDNNVSVDFIHADLAYFDIGETKWDAIVSIFCHVSPVIRKRLHGAISKGLKSGGIFLLEAYTPQQLAHGTGGPPNKELMMSAQQLSQELQGLNFTHLVEREREIIEGTHHFGVGAVVQLLGIKDE